MRGQACEALLRCLPSAGGLTAAGPDGAAQLWEADAVLASRVQFLVSMLVPCVPRLAQVPDSCSIALHPPGGAQLLPSLAALICPLPPVAGVITRHCWLLDHAACKQRPLAAIVIEDIIVTQCACLLLPQDSLQCASKNTCLAGP